MVKTQGYLRAEELDALHRTARRSGRPVADLVRGAIRRVWLRPPARGPVALWDGMPTLTSIEYDTVCDKLIRHGEQVAADSCARIAPAFDARSHSRSRA